MSNLWFLILDPVGLVNHQVSPVELFEHRLFNDEHFIGCDAHVPFSRQQHVSDQSSLRKIKTRIMWRITPQYTDPLWWNRTTVDFRNELLNHSHAVSWSGLPSHLGLQSGRLHAAKAPIAWIHSSSCRGWTWEPAPCGGLEYFCSASCNPTEQWSAESFLDPVRWSRGTPSLKLPEWKQSGLLIKYQPSHLPGCHWYHSHIRKSASWDHGPGNLAFFLFWHLEGKSSANDHVFN